MNKLRRLLALVLCLVILCCASLPVQAASPRLIMINNVRDLLKLADNCRLDNYSQELTVVLAADLDLTDTGFTSIPLFCGIFHGNGFRITGLDLSDEGSSQGFFRILTQEAQVTDLHLEGAVSPTGSAGDVGGIAGINHGRISHCSFSGALSGNDRVGGIAGTNTLTGIIENCSVGGSIHGSHFVGGIAGNNLGVIRDSDNHAAVNNTVEQNSVSLEDITLDSLTGSEAAITVTDIGGIAGTGTGVLRDCHNYGNIGYPQIGYNIGGIAGSYKGYIASCVNHGQIQGRKEVGGILGQLEPAVNLLYSQDTLQSLQDQMGQMANTAQSVGGHIQNGANALTGFSDQLDGYIRNAQDALALLVPDPNDPQMPDQDALEAAMNALSGSISGISSALSVMLSTGMASFSGLTQDIHSLTGQMTQLGGTINGAAENLGGSITDISDMDTPADVSAKVEDCQNLGAVSGDWNIGGIVGGVAPENDLDPESDLQLIGTTSFNFNISLRAVITDCDNSGTVTGKKQKVGGIVGWASLGLIKDCTNTATVDASNANYCGGIAGQSLGFIRGSNAKCTLAGKNYVGGIAGTGATVTDCRSIVHLEGIREKFGAVLGDLENAQLENNYYLASPKDPGAIDGISYAGKAQGLDANAFFDLEGIPGIFRLVTVTFDFGDGTIHRSTLPYGSALATVGFPKIPANAGADAAWEGPIGLHDPVDRDVTFRIATASHVYTLESQVTTKDGFPMLLLQGQFHPGTTFTVNEAASEGYAAAWSLILPESLAPMQLRCRLPDGCPGDETQVQLRLTDGTWQTVSAQQQGSYLVMQLPGSVTGVRLLHAPQDLTPYFIAGIAGILILILVIIAVIILRRKRKQHQK